MVCIPKVIIKCYNFVKTQVILNKSIFISLQTLYYQSYKWFILREYILSDQEIVDCILCFGKNLSSFGFLAFGFFCGEKTKCA